MLDRLGGVGGDLGGQRPDLARLVGEHVELVANEGRLQLDDLAESSWRRRGFLARSKAGIEIALGKIDELAVEGGGALAGGVERSLERVDRLFECSLPRS